MSDVTSAGGDAAGEQETIAQTPPTQAQAPQTGAGDTGSASLASLAEDTGGEPLAPSDWPHDWRERWAGNDAKELARLKRFASPDNVYKSGRDVERKLSATRPVEPLPENPTPEQVAEYRKAIGIPEAPDGYGVQFAPEVQADERLNGALQNFLAYAHERNLPPATVKAAVEWQQQQILQQREEQIAAAQREKARVTSELRKEYGADYKVNLKLADEFLEAHPGIGKLVRADNPDLELVRDIIKLARDTAPEDMLFSGDGDSGGKGLDEQLNALTQKSIRGQLSEAEDEKYNRLIAARMKRDERRTRAA